MQKAHVHPRIQSRPRRLRGLLLLLSGVVAFLLFAAPVAMADDPIGDTAGSATDTVNDTAGSATDTVNDTAGSATDTVNDTAGSTTDTVNDTAGSATDTVNDTAGSATDTVNDTAGSATDTVNDTAGSATDTVNDTAGSATNAVGANQLAQTGNQGGDTLTSDGGAASNPLRSTPSVASKNTPSELSAPLAHDDPDPQTDPCDEDSSLVCLGVLYGLGDATDTGADVLGTLVRTGAGVVFLAAIALLLGILGTAALAASRSRLTFAPGRAR